MAEVRNHNTEDDLWMVLENKVFDLTDFVSIHPGGPGYLTMNAGMDGTDPFQDVHFGIFSRAEVMEYYIGDLDMSSKFEWVFEMSRPLKTDSTKTDAQFMEGKSVDFGFSFWVSPLFTRLSWCYMFISILRMLIMDVHVYHILTGSTWVREWLDQFGILYNRIYQNLDVPSDWSANYRGHESWGYLD